MTEYRGSNRVRPSKDDEISPLYKDLSQEDSNSSSTLSYYPNEIPRETIRSVYGNDFDTFDSSIKQIEEKAKKYFSETLTELDKKYQQFNSNINKYIVDLTNKITEAFKLQEVNEEAKTKSRNNSIIGEDNSTFVQKYSKEYIERLNKIVNMHEQIIESIKQTVSILFNFLDISKSLDKEKPIQDFLGKEFNNIINCWLFLKLDIEKFDFAQAVNDSDLDSNFKELITKICKGKNFVMNISAPKQYMIEDKYYNGALPLAIIDKINNERKKNKLMIIENCSNILKLKINNTIDASGFFEEISSVNNMKYLKLNCITFRTKQEPDSFLQKCPNLEKLVIKNTRNFDYKLLSYLPSKLIYLSLTKIGFVNFEFNHIMTNYLIKSDNLRKTLQYLSFANNNLTFIDFNQMITKPRQGFFVLKELDFSKNQIYKFNITLDYFSELKILNLCYNSFTKDYFATFKNIMVLQGCNTYLSNLNSSTNYYTKLEKQLNTFPISLRYLNLSYMPSALSNDYLSNLKINDSILIGIKKLDLSINHITNDVFFKFIENNKGILNLKELVLKSNRLNDAFFEKFLNLNYDNIFTKLNRVTLDFNFFGSEDSKINYKDYYEPTDKNLNGDNNIYKIRLLYKFIQSNKNLDKLSLMKNLIFEKYTITNMYPNSKIEYPTDSKGNIIISSINTLFAKIKNEILISRPSFNLKFDCASGNHQNSSYFTNDFYPLEINNDSK